MNDSVQTSVLPNRAEIGKDKQTTWVRRSIGRLVTLAVSCLLAALLLECLIRVSGFDVPRVWVPDPELGWHHIPGARTHWTEEGDGQVEINSLGYRDRLDRTENKPAGALRIAVFGDSMTEGVQVNLDQTYCYRLEEQCSHSGRRIEILNLGVNGYGPLQELLLFRREAPRLKPDVAILAVFLDNDVADCDPRLRYTDVGVPFGTVLDGSLRIDQSRPEKSSADYRNEPSYTLRRFSATYRATRDGWMKFSEAKVARATAGSVAAPNVPKRYQLYQTVPQPYWNEAWITFEQVLIEFKAEAMRHQIQPIVLSVPAGQVTSPVGWQSIIDKNPGMAEVAFGLDAPEERLRELAKRHSLPLIQPYLEYRKSPQDPALFFGHNGHFTHAGHDLMNRIVFDELITGGILQPPPADR